MWRSLTRTAECTAFQLAVYELCYAIPPGRVTVYSELAKALDPSKPLQQATGSALRSNPFAPEVPCHRVLKGGTPPTIGGFNGATQDQKDHPEIARKMAILRAEGISLSADGRKLQDLSQLFHANDWPQEAIKRARDVLAGKYKWPQGTHAVKGAAMSSSAIVTADPDKAVVSTEAAVRGVLSRPGCPGALVRSHCAAGKFTGHTSGCAPGFAQANLVILPREYAYDFLLFCVRNPKACPLLEVTDCGSPFLKEIAAGADVRSDLPKYRIWRHGVMESEVTDIKHLWPTPSPSSSSSMPSSSSTSPDARSDWVAFLIGCSFSFEEALLEARLPVRHLQEGKATAEEAGADGAAASPSTSASGSGAGAGAGAGSKRKRNDADTPDAPSGTQGEKQASAALAAAGTIVSNPRNVPMYRTGVLNSPSGVFGGQLVVSMRPMTPVQATKAGLVTATFPRVHGKCIHAGDPLALGIADINKPDYGDAVSIHDGEVPVFWACGVTPQAALLEANIPIAITHSPGHMLVLDVSNKQLAGHQEFDLSKVRMAASSS